MEKQESWIKKNVLLIFIGIIILMIIVYIANFHNGFSSSDNSWGNFGSYFGSFTGLLAFGGVLYTAWQSEKRAEEEKARREQAEQHTKDVEKKAEEDSIKREDRDLFFKLLNLHQEKLKSISYKEVVCNDPSMFIIKGINSSEYTKLPPTVTMLKGINACEKYNSIANSILYDYQVNDCIIKMGCNKFSNDTHIDSDILYRLNSKYPNLDYVKVKEYINKIIDNPNSYQGIINKNIYYEKKSPYSKYQINYDINDLYKAIKLSGNIMNIKYGQIFGQYYRNMFYVLETCNQFRYNKDYYFKLFRAQLSRVEIILCLLNAISDKSSPKFVNLLNDNNILDDLYYSDLVPIKFDDKYKGKELQFVTDMLNLYLEEHKESN